MRLGFALGYWGRRPPDGVPELVAEAVDLGYESVWTAEAYGSDAITPLAWWGARFPTLRLGTAIAQLSARTPTGTAMAAMTLDHLSGGRFVLGLGVSGPQVVEGWYGDEYAVRMGYDAEAKEVQRLYLSGAKQEAEAALPLSLIEKLALIGPAAKIADDMAAWRRSPVDTLMVQGDATALRAAAAALRA